MGKDDLKAAIGLVIGMLIGTMLYKTGKYLVTGNFHFDASNILNIYVPVFLGSLLVYIIVKNALPLT